MNSISVLHINLFQSEKNAPDFYFNTLRNHLVSSHKHIEKPHRHDFYVTVIFTKGTGIHEIDFQKYDVSEGSLFFLSPGQVHSWELSPDTDGYIFFFSQPYYEMHYVNQKLKNFPFFNSPSFPRKLQLQSTELEAMIRLFEAIQNEHQSQNVMKQSFILSLISQIYIQSVREFSKGDEKTSATSVSYFKHYQDFENLLEESFTSQKSISFYASQLNISAKHLNRITQTVMQKTASEIITERVILEAKRMLIYLDEGLVEIAFRLGYEEYSYFARMFRKNTGITPSQFIKNHKN
ncbi:MULTISPECIES: helix-turn-helix transcriptional regulator [Chryseobacterium]|jgi:AraC-like DNA-binding protein|uniref:AraC-type DNA-binding protein n=1 Tax=Chryseobacterium balustinum TaxID=246 RepID=A0AAX2IN29_9FLAO|nr:MULTISPECIES: helix-turn-helix transcriptional regulator [Chryseobacterium]AZB29936.1 helix-turn-helix domain-containing protein [Chryseobacterium balustinum]SKB96850.1 AraC-type DNA-binding protein [Chryseobacterium balustinum]SQA90388.1 Bacillibactin transport regulator [Chryseobacterium balustinum]